MSISVRYIYSACVKIKTEDVKVLCDPWFTQGAYDGSWFHFPQLENPIDKIGNVDIIYISHIHSDHYDPKFLKEYFNVYGNKEIVIDDFGILLNANKDNESYKIMREDNNLPFPRTEVIIDKAYLFGLITMIYHWNNAEIGSHFISRRFPNKFN